MIHSVRKIDVLRKKDPEFDRLINSFVQAFRWVEPLFPADFAKRGRGATVPVRRRSSTGRGRDRRSVPHLRTQAKSLETFGLSRIHRSGVVSFRQ